MNMHMHPRLPRCLPNIYPDVEAVGRMLGMNELSCLAKKLNNRELFLECHFEEVRNVAFWNYEDMTTTQRMAVRAYIGQFVLGEYGFRGTELALLTLFHRSPFVLSNVPSNRRAPNVLCNARPSRARPG